MSECGQMLLMILLITEIMIRDSSFFLIIGAEPANEVNNGCNGTYEVVLRGQSRKKYALYAKLFHDSSLEEKW